MHAIFLNMKFTMRFMECDVGGSMNVQEKDIKEYTPKNAIILAAGYGMRMAPINMETPKGLLEIHGETLIERLIKQLHEVGINKIYIVVGFMKEQYEYLIDKYGVELVVNNEYSSKNNLHSMKRITMYLSNSYIVPCDIWCKTNPFCAQELYSWYMVTDSKNEESKVRVNRKGELVSAEKGTAGNQMIGIAYLLEEDAAVVRKQIEKMCKEKSNDDAFWEEALYENGRMIIPGRIVSESEYVEINTFEQLRDLDSASNQLKSEAIEVIKDVFKVSSEEITDITVLKKGMTNRSFLFHCKGKKYIMRIPGEGTEQLINRAEEASVYQAISGKGISDDIAYINPENGYKITEFLEEARVCDPYNVDDLKNAWKH